MGDSYDDGKIFVWAQVGEKLKAIDEKRMITISQQNSDYALSVAANDSILDAVHRIKAGDDFADIKQTMDDLNYLDDLFRQIGYFMHEQPHDLISIGSFITGEMKSKNALLDLSGDSND